MASLQQILSWFKTGLFPNEDQFRQTWLSYWHKSEKIPQSQVFGLQETIESATRGLIYQNPVPTKSALATTYPNAKVGWASMVLDEGYIYSFNGTTWANTGLKEFPEDVATKADLAHIERDNPILNISQTNNKYDYTSATARAAVPASERWSGREIRYKTAEKWINEQFIGDDIADWEDSSLWKEANGFDSTEQYLYVITDSDKKVVLAIRGDGSVEIPKGIPDEVVTRFAEVATQLSDIGNRVPVDAPEKYLYVITDSDKKIVLAIREDGSVEIPKGIPSEVATQLTALWERAPIDAPEGYLYAITDSVKKVVLAIREDGSVEIPKLKGGDISRVAKDVDLLNAISDKTPASEIRIPRPNTVPRVYFNGVTVAELDPDEPIECEFKYIDDEGNYFEKVILLTLQGSSSLDYHKKNYGFDILNKDGSECSIRVGDWVPQDSFHFKANFIDATHFRNVGICQLYDKMRRTLPAGQVYPFQPPYVRDAASFPNRFPTGALGHIDGFPIELYINDLYHGLYTWNLKVHRANFDMKKGNQYQVLLKQDSDYGMDFYTYRETDWEFKNPKSPDAESVEVAQKIFAWLKSVDEVPNQALFEATHNEYVFLDSLIDYYLTVQLFGATDCIVKNMNLYTLDGKKWYLGIYDMDTTFGLNWNGTKITEAEALGIIDLRNNAFLRIVDRWRKDEIKARFKFLCQDGGVLSPLNVDKHIYDFMSKIGNDNYEKDFDHWAWAPIPSAVYKPQAVPGTTCSTGYTQLAQWYRDRVDYLAREWGVNLQTI